MCYVSALRYQSALSHSIPQCLTTKAFSFPRDWGDVFTICDSVWDGIGEGNGTPLQYSCPEKAHGRRSLVGCSPWGRKELDTTELLHFHFSLSCIGEGNGNPLQCSCLENPRDGGAWWAAICGVTQSRTRLKRLSSSSSSSSSILQLNLIQI